MRSKRSKRAFLRLADILVVNKADLPLADRVVAQLEAMLNLREAARSRGSNCCSCLLQRASGIAELGGGRGSARSIEQRCRSCDSCRGRALQKLLARARRETCVRPTCKQAVPGTYAIMRKTLRRDGRVSPPVQRAVLANVLR